MKRSVAGAIAGMALLAAAVSCSNDSPGSSDSSTASGQSVGPADLATTSAKASQCTPYGSPPAKLVADMIPGESVPLCLLGKRLGPWQDADGYDRYACLYEPLGASSTASLPLLVFLHASLFTPDTNIPFTNLLELQNVTSLSDSPTRTGFVILAPQGRSTKHFYPAPDDQGMGWDNWYRQLQPEGALVGGKLYPGNVDAATIDHFIEQQVDTGKIDENRIFLTGWSNGSAMAILYALSRPGIASIAVYSAPDPFHVFNDPCPQQPVIGGAQNDGEIEIFNERLPIMHVHNDCDVTGTCPNGERMAGILRAQGSEVDDRLINSLLLPATGGCLDICGTDPNASTSLLANPLSSTLGLVNHTRWPHLTTGEMLQFLREHPLDGPRP